MDSVRLAVGGSIDRSQQCQVCGREMKFYCPDGAPLYALCDNDECSRWLKASDLVEAQK